MRDCQKQFKTALTADELAALNAAHFGNIKLVDAMHVLDMCGHIGEQVKKNLPLAKA